MNKHSLWPTIFLIITFMILPADAHEVFSEGTDFSREHPFVVADSIESAKAVYGRMEPASDIDVYSFTVTSPVRVHARAFVPLVKGVEKFLPSLAVVGPGLPVAGEKLPFTVPQGYGAIVVNNTPPGVKRPTFFEPFSGTEYYDAPAFDQTVATAGKWYIYYWDPYKMGGDYVAILGFREKYY